MISESLLSKVTDRELEIRVKKMEERMDDWNNTQDGTVSRSLQYQKQRMRNVTK